MLSTQIYSGNMTTVTGRRYRRGSAAFEREKIATRRTEVARLYPTMSITEIANEFGCSRKPIEDDVNALAEAGVLTKRPRGRIAGTKMGYEFGQKVAAAKLGKPRSDVAEKLNAVHADRHAGGQHAQLMLRMIKARKWHKVKPNTIRAWNLRTTKSKGAPPKYHPDTRGEVQRLRSEGCSWGQIVAELGIPKGTARYMAAAPQKRS